MTETSDSNFSHTEQLSQSSEDLMRMDGGSKVGAVKFDASSLEVISRETDSDLKITHEAGRGFKIDKASDEVKTNHKWTDKQIRSRSEHREYDTPTAAPPTSMAALRNSNPTSNQSLLGDPPSGSQLVLSATNTTLYYSPLSDVTKTVKNWIAPYESDGSPNAAPILYRYLDEVKVNVAAWVEKTGYHFNGSSTLRSKSTFTETDIGTNYVYRGLELQEPSSLNNWTETYVPVESHTGGITQSITHTKPSADNTITVPNQGTTTTVEPGGEYHSGTSLLSTYFTVQKPLSDFVGQFSTETGYVSNSATTSSNGGADGAVNPDGGPAATGTNNTPDSNDKLMKVLADFGTINLDPRYKTTIFLGMTEGFVVDGFTGTVVDVWDSVAGYPYFVWAYYYGGMDSAAQTQFGQTVDQGTQMALEHGPTVARIYSELLSGQLSGDTLMLMVQAAVVVEAILEGIKDEFAEMSPEEKARLIGRIQGAVLFEVALAVGTAGAGNAVGAAAKAGKFAAIVAKIEKFYPSLGKKIARALDKLNPDDCHYKTYCFSPTTLVETPQGKRAIREIEAGEHVYAFDFEAGQWVAREVVKRHDNLYLGAWLTLHTSGGTIECTAYHPFWVIDGYALEERPRPRSLAEREDEGQSLIGRWVNSHVLMAGDLLIGRNGEQVRLLKIEQEFVTDAPICNLTIDKNHSFAVGNDGVLVHNTPDECFGSLVRNDDLLAKNLGGRIDGYTPHHLIPVAEAEKFDIMQRAAELGYDINRGGNGINLPNTEDLAKRLNLPYHPRRGRHRVDTYTGPVDERLRNLQQRYDDGLIDDTTLLDEIRKIEDSIHDDLISGKLRLNSRYPWYPQ